MDGETPEYELVLPESEVMDRPAPVALRTFAFLVDIVVASIVLILPFTAAFLFSAGIQTMDSASLESFLYSSPHILAVFDVSTFFILLFYFSVFESMTGQTVGKRFLKLRVEPRISFGKALVRNLSKASVFSIFTIPVLSYIVFLDIIWFLFGRERLLSLATKTKVLYETRLGDGVRWTQEL